MTTSSQAAARERLSWVDDARQGILRAIGDDVINPNFKAFPTVDPIKHILKITLRLPLSKSTRSHLRAYLRCWAEMNGCEVPIIRITDKHIQAEVLTKHRYWRRNAQGRFKPGGKRFIRRPR